MERLPPPPPPPPCGVKLPPPPPVTVAGRINSPAFQKAKATVEGLPSEVSVTLKPLMPADYDTYLYQLRRDVGGLSWTHTAGVVVSTDDGDFVGDDDAFVLWLRTHRVKIAQLNSDGKARSWEELANEAFFEHLSSTGLTYAYLDFALDGENIGRLLFEMFSDLLPKTCTNFLQLCTGEKGKTPSGTALTYKNNPVHRIVKGGWIQAGDIKSGDGDGGASAFGEALPDESFAIKHAVSGLLGMAKAPGPHTAASQFYVTLRALPTFDNANVAFGRLIDGTKLLEFLAETPTSCERPVGELVICGCGQLSLAQVNAYDQEQAATKMQAITKGRAARKEREEQAKAATKIANSKRKKEAKAKVEGKRQDKKKKEESAAKLQARKRGNDARKKKGDAPAAE